MYCSYDFGRGQARVRAGISTLVGFVTACSALLDPVRAFADIKPVPAVQRTLSELGFDAGGADGIWGAKSIAALKAFQRSKGLNPSGFIDQASLYALFPIALASGDQLPPGSYRPASEHPMVSNEPAKAASEIERPEATTSTEGAGTTHTKKSDGGGAGAALFVGVAAVFLWAKYRSGKNKGNSSGRRRSRK